MTKQRGAIDSEQVDEQYRDATVLVTGGTGSFGEAILNRLLQTPVREVRVCSRDEQKHVALRRRCDDSRLRCMVGDVRDPARVAQVVRGTQYVFHAAALKHVDFTEMHPYEAVRTNIDGAQNVALACQDAGVRTLVAVSTDKAVAPINVMGMTKAIQERLICAAAGDRGLRSGCVRYGNVLASNGSVVPYFRELIRRGHRTLPVTDPAMTRFMLTLREGVDLALYAAGKVNNGEIVVADLPAFRVMDLAEVMLESVGGGDVRIVGVRPGEKIHEALISNEELRRTERHGDYFVINRRRGDDDHHETAQEEYTSETVRMMSKPELKEALEREGLLG